MKYISQSQRTTVRTSDATTAVEYDTGSTTINAAVINIAGRYPANGWASNSASTSLIYIIAGHGSAIVDSQEVLLYKDDQLLIDVGEKYVFEGHLQILYAATPAWTREQAEHLLD